MLHYISKTFLALTLPFAVMQPAHAEAPNVVTDIAPVQALVQAVMGDLGTPAVILPPHASAHSYSMRPSDAATLARADLVFWIGSDLAPWLAEPLETLAENAETIALARVPGTETLPLRGGAHAHAHGEEAHEEEGHEEEAHEEEGHAHEEGHEEEAHEEEGHGGSLTDPHMWLDPHNASIWIAEIAEHLAEHDPENAATYQENALQARAEITALSDQITAMLPTQDALRFITFHDALQYFEQHFDRFSHGALVGGDEGPISPAQFAELLATISRENISCLLAEPDSSQDLVAALKTESITVHVIDPLGTPRVAQGMTGMELYRHMLLDLAQAFHDC